MIYFNNSHKENDQQLITHGIRYLTDNGEERVGVWNANKIAELYREKDKTIPEHYQNQKFEFFEKKKNKKK